MTAEQAEREIVRILSELDAIDWPGLTAAAKVIGRDRFVLPGPVPGYNGTLTRAENGRWVLATAARP